MGCTSSTMVGDRKERREARKKRKEATIVTHRHTSERWPSVRTNSLHTTLAEPALSQKDEHPKTVGSLDNFTVGTNDVTTKEECPLEDSPPGGDGLLKDPSPPTVSPPDLISSNLARSTSKGSIVRNGVYYSESELAEEGIPWQPKYWTPDRIGKWIEDTEFPESVRFTDVRKGILQSGGKKEYRLPEVPRRMYEPNNAVS